MNSYYVTTGCQHYFGNLPLTIIKEENVCVFFSLLGYLQAVRIFKNLYAQRRGGGKGKKICILNCGQNIVLISSLSGNGKIDKSFYYLKKKTIKIILWSKYLLGNKILVFLKAGTIY